MFKVGSNYIFILLDIGLQQTTRVIGYCWRLSSPASKVWTVALETNFLPTILFSRLCRYWMYDSSENYTDIGSVVIETVIQYKSQAQASASTKSYFNCFVTQEEGAYITGIEFK